MFLQCPSNANAVGLLVRTIYNYNIEHVLFTKTEYYNLQHRARTFHKDRIL